MFLGISRVLSHLPALNKPHSISASKGDDLLLIPLDPWSASFTLLNKILISTQIRVLMRSII
jgi:hypothetical protein